MPLDRFSISVSSSECETLTKTKKKRRRHVPSDQHKASRHQSIALIECIRNRKPQENKERGGAAKVNKTKNTRKAASNKV